MKTCRYIVEIEMPDGDFISAGWLKDLIRTDCDVEDEGRKKVTVQEISLPSNLDEAAEEIINNAIDTNDTTIVKNEGLLRYLVKAGAEWMAGQGKTIECSIDWYDGPILDFSELQLYSAIVKAELEVGDKVIVQIRKK